MIRNYFKTAWRNLWKHKSLSFINICGLISGMTCSLLIFLFVADELSYDRFNKDAERIYRVVKDFVNTDGSRLPDATTPPAIAPAIQKEIPGIEHVTRVFPPWGNNYLVTYNDKNFYEKKVFRADSSFFDVFTFSFAEGDARSAFKEVKSVILTETTAQKYFGNENPMGKVLKIDSFGDLMVSGVLKDLPENAHFHFDFLLPVRTFGLGIDNNWRFHNFYTYIKLQPNVNIANVESEIKALYKRHRPDENNIYYTQALTGIHLGSNLKWELEPNGDRLYVIVFSIVGIFIILIAAINYINLVTARSALRAKEVGVRKVAGAGQGSLIRQFLLESVLMSLLSAVIALLIAQLLLPLVNTITSKQLALNPGTSYNVICFISGAVLLGILAGLFPALYLSSFQPTVVLKGVNVNEKGVFNLRKALVVVQFTISVALISGSLIIYRQVSYIQSARLGLNKDQVLITQNYNNIPDSRKSSFENELRQIRGVKNAAASGGIVGGLNYTRRLNLKGSDNGAVVNFLFTGYDYLDVLEIKLREGRNFSRDFPADVLSEVSNKTLEQDIGSIILNERAVKDLDIPDPVIGRQIQWNANGDTTYYVKVIGVTEDFHFASFRNEIKPFAFLVRPQGADNMTLKLSTQNLTATLQQIENKWRQFLPERPFQYSFLDETFARLYKAEANFQKIFIALVLLSIVIACLGLFGLSAFTAERRIKEIGIRKVLGASVTGITAMLSKDFLILVITANLIAAPLAWWGMNRWLQGYAYRIEVNAWIFLIAAGVSVLIALFTVSFHSIKAATTNPVKSLRTE